MDTDTSELLEKLAKLKKFNDNNSKNLLKLGIDENNLPSDLQSKIKRIVEAQKETGLHDPNMLSLEVLHVNKKVEAVMLEQDIMRPLQRKVNKLAKEVEKAEKKINTLTESVTSFEGEMISDEDFNNQVQNMGARITEGEKAITEMPMPPLELDCDDIIKKTNIVKMEKKSKVNKK